jgi:hypothetical protein
MSCLKILKKYTSVPIFKERSFIIKCFFFTFLILSRIHPFLFLAFSLFFILALINLKILCPDYLFSIFFFIFFILFSTLIFLLIFFLFVYFIFILFFFFFHFLNFLNLDLPFFWFFLILNFFSISLIFILFFFKF